MNTCDNCGSTSFIRRNQIFCDPCQDQGGHPTTMNSAPALSHGDLHTETVYTRVGHEYADLVTTWSMDTLAGVLVLLREQWTQASKADRPAIQAKGECVKFELAYRGSDS